MSWTTAKALHVLDLLPAEANSVRSIRAAFARLCKEQHPDKQPLEQQYQWSIDSLKAARDFLLSEAKAAGLSCKLCGGKGKLRATMGWRQCGACKGTGDKQ